MSRSLDLSGHGFVMLFRDAVKSTERALRKKWGKGTEIPLLSHALSQHDGFRWHVSDIAGQPIALVDAAGKAILADEIEIMTKNDVDPDNSLNSQLE